MGEDIPMHSLSQYAVLIAFDSKILIPHERNHVYIKDMKLPMCNCVGSRQVNLLFPGYISTN